MREKMRRMLGCVVLAMTVAAPCGALLAAIAEPVDLGSAVDFGALAGGAISGTGKVKGNVGSASGAIAPAITSTGTIYPTGHVAATTALTDSVTAYNEGKGRTPDFILSAAAYELGGTTLTPGVHKIGAAATVANSFTLDAGGNADAVFIIQITGAFGTTAATGNVVLANDAQSRNVFWIVEGAVSLGAGTHMEGTLLGGAAISCGAGTTLNGRALASSSAGAIAMATAITVPPEPSVVGDRVWFDSNSNGIQDPAESTGFHGVPVTLFQLVLESVTINLGTAANFGALAGGAISGSGNVAGNVGSGTGAVAPAITATGTKFATGNAATMTALADYATAYNDGLNRTPGVILSAAAYELGGTTLTPGVYKIGAAATLASPVTLDGEGDSEAVFIIQITGAFGTTASAGNVILTNQAKSANVFWIVEGAVSVGANSQMEGNILGGAAITFGASSNLSGRALAGSSAGTIALATTVSLVTGAPPVGFPPPIAVAETVTDANGKYLFENVLPGTYVVCWNLSGISNDFRITTTKQGSDDALDSDSASGDVGGAVDSAATVILGGTTHHGVDLGLLETLPAIKTTAIEGLMAARVSYLVANSYTAGNWEALRIARADGAVAINAAIDATGVATAKAAALAAMDAIPTFSESLAAAKTPALNDLAVALATYLPSDYTAGDWTTLTTAHTNGTLAIQAATDPADVEAAKAASLAAMATVPTIAETLAAAKAAALGDLAAALAASLAATYPTAEQWAELTGAKSNGETAIVAATDLTGVTKALDTALDAIAAVAGGREPMAITHISRTSGGEVTLVLRTTPSKSLTLQTSTDFTDPMSWTTIATETPGTATWTFIHGAGLATGPRRFYRAFLNP